MFHKSVLVVFVMVCELCTIGESGVVPSKQLLQSYVTEVRDRKSELDCSQFIDDFDVLRQFPFPVVINPTDDSDYEKSTARVNESENFVRSISIRYEKYIPSSIYCLSNLHQLHVQTTPFENGIMSDDFANFKNLTTINIYDSLIQHITERFSTLTNLDFIQMINCSITSLPDIENLDKLTWLELPDNNLTRIGKLPGLHALILDGNYLTEIPMTKNPDNLELLDINYNPINSPLRILEYKNLKTLFIKFTNIGFIPAAIDQLQKLEYLDIARNNLTDFPYSVLNLPNLEYFNATRNLFSSGEIESIKAAFKELRPNTIVRM